MPVVEVVKPVSELVSHHFPVKIVVEIVGVLLPYFGQAGVCGKEHRLTVLHGLDNGKSESFGYGGEQESGAMAQIPVLLAFGRSEERRVGKECRSRWSPYH